MGTKISNFLDQEAAEAEERADAEERGELEETPSRRARRQAAEPSQVYSVRIPVDRLEELRRIADSLGEAPSSLLRQWVIERLDVELRRLGRTTRTRNEKPSTGAPSRSELEDIVLTALNRYFSAQSAEDRAAAGSSSDADRLRLGSTRRLVSDLVFPPDSPASDIPTHTSK